MGEQGFRLSAAVQLSARALGAPTGPEQFMFAWHGFDQVYDDCGYRYLLQHWDLGVPHRRGGSREQLQLAFYSAVVPEATQLTFAATPMIVYARRWHLPQRPAVLPDLLLGDLRWQFAVPR